MVNVLKLKGKIIEKGFSVSKLAALIDMDKTTFYRRLSEDGKTFTIGEIEKIVETLSLSAEEAREIFFVQYVA